VNFRSRFFTLLALILFGLLTGAIAQSLPATTPSEQLQECMSERRNYPVEAKKCMIACRGVRAENAESYKINTCRKAYNEFRRASGKPEGAPINVESFSLDKLTARFSYRNGRLNRFELIGEHSELGQRAARVCVFEFPEDQAPTQARLNDRIRELSSQGKNIAYQFNDISWSEDGLNMHYPCRVERVDVVAID